MEADQQRDRATERRVSSRGAYRTERLRLVPIGVEHASELWEIHRDEGVAFTEVHNARSRAVMGRLGMQYARRILRSGFVAGSSEMREDAPSALYRIARAAHDRS